jgi:hypothetical protein
VIGLLVALLRPRWGRLLVGGLVRLAAVVVNGHGRQSGQRVHAGHDLAPLDIPSHCGDYDAHLSILLLRLLSRRLLAEQKRHPDYVRALSLLLAVILMLLLLLCMLDPCVLGLITPEVGRSTFGKGLRRRRLFPDPRA